MANHSYTRAGGVWDPDTDLLASELADLDAKTVDSISGTGGTYSLTNPIVIGSAVGPSANLQINCGMGITGVVEFYADVTFYEDVTLGFDNTDVITILGGLDIDSGAVSVGTTALDQLGVYSTTEFFSPVTFHDDVVFGHVNGTIQSGGTWLIDADLLTIGQDFDADFVVNSGAGFYNGVTFHSVVGFADNGKIAGRSKVISVPGNQTVVAALYDSVLIPDGVLASLSTDIKIDDTGAADGMRIRFMSQDNTNIAYIRRPDNSSIANGITSVSGSVDAIEVERIAGVWTLMSASHRY